MKAPEISVEVQKKLLHELENYGDYDAMRYVGKWKSYDIFSPCYMDSSVPYFDGFPTYYAVKGEEIKMYGYDESKEYSEIYNIDE